MFQIIIIIYSIVVFIYKKKKYITTKPHFYRLREKKVIYCYKWQAIKELRLDNYLLNESWSAFLSK